MKHSVIELHKLDKEEVVEEEKFQGEEVEEV